MSSWLEVRKSCFFPFDSGLWLAIFRTGLGIQVTLFTWSLRNDWQSLFRSDPTGPSLRVITEIMLSSQEGLTPQIGWLVRLGEQIGVSENTALLLVWLILLLSGFFLIAGLFCRPAAVAAWFLYLCSVKSAGLYSYGVDNFTTIGLVYLMIAPLPDRWAMDLRVRKMPMAPPHRFGFHRRILQVHLSLIYFFGGVSKCLGRDWWNGNSLWRALTRPPFDLVPSHLLIHVAFLLPAIGIAVCFLEAAYVVFIWPKATRLFWLCGVVLMHLAIGLTMGLYLFALIMIVFNLAAFAPGVLVERHPLLLFPSTAPEPLT